MSFWPLFGVTRMLTEPRISAAGGVVLPLPRLFRRSLHIYPVDVGNSHALNLEVAAMKTAQYNIHRYGIFFADTPRHADVLLLLGTPLPSLRDYLRETLEQLPRPYGVVWIMESPIDASDEDGEEMRRRIQESGGTLLSQLARPRGPEEIIAVLRAAMAGGKRL